MDTQKVKKFNTDNIFQVIDAWTDETVRRKLEEQQTRFSKQLVPELKLELAVKELQERTLARMESDHAVRNLAAKFVQSLKGGLFEDAYQCFALDTADTWAAIEKYGVYKGAEKLREYFVDYYGKLGGGEGCFIEHELTTPVVEVAGDNETAKAMFLTEGVLAIDCDHWMETHGVARSFWQIGPWYMEFIKENGVWKIWHLTVFDDVETPYEQSRSEFTDHASLIRTEAPAPTAPLEDAHYFTPERAPFLHREPPRAYGTYAEGEVSC